MGEPPSINGSTERGEPRPPAGDKAEYSRAGRPRVPGPWEPPETERALGIGFYVTATPGFAARLKGRPEDFRVDEISTSPRPDPAGEYTVLRVVSRNWEQHELSQRLASALGLPPHAISWSGTKDRRAVADRLASYRGRPPTGRVTIPDAEIVEAYTACDGLSLGHHIGNAFTVRLGVPADRAAAATEAARATADALRARSGFANLFGPQRFGEVRPVTHEVGRQLVRGDVEGAVRTYLCAIPEGGDSLGADARRQYAGHGDPVRALKEFPAHFRFERTLLDRLSRGDGAARALHALPRELRRLFVHAYQSWLFNRWVTARAAHGLPLDQVVDGDLVVRIGRDGTPRSADPVAVTSSNLAECQETVARGGARLAGALVGYDTPPVHGTPGELLAEILTSEKIARRDFSIPAIPDLASAGTVRPVWVDLPLLGIAAPAPSTGSATDDPALTLTFALPKGAYATILLREFLKDGATAPAPAPVATC